MKTMKNEFQKLVEENKSTIYSVCYMFSKDEDEVADLFQEILINLWKGFDNFRGESSPRTWIWKASLNTCITADRKKKRKAQQIPLDMNINLFDDSDADSQQIHYADLLRIFPGLCDIYHRTSAHLLHRDGPHPLEAVLSGPHPRKHSQDGRNSDQTQKSLRSMATIRNPDEHDLADLDRLRSVLHLHSQ